MKSSDYYILSNILKCIQAKKKVTLCTVLETWGGAPFSPGTLAAFTEDKQIFGSLSSGCIESDLLEYLDKNNHQIFTVKSYKDNNKLKIPCGGKLDILIEPISDANLILQLMAAIRKNMTVSRIVDIETEKQELVNVGEVNQAKVFCGRYVTRSFGPARQLILIGAGEISRHVADIARKLNYYVVVCEPREEFRVDWHMDGVDLDTRMPDDVVVDRVNERTAVITLTHDPKLDDMALMEALSSKAFYVGALGSIKTNEARCERLRQLGIPENDIMRLHGPVGISIGSRTAPQIAISILAELIKEQGELY